MKYLAKCILASCIVISSLFTYQANTAQQVQLTITVHTYRVSLQTSDGRRIIDTVTAESENRARVIIESRYPNCIIFSITEVR
jgi:hypothetical protein